MLKNRNGYWMSPKWFALFAPDDGAGNGGEGGADNGNEDSGAEEDGADADDDGTHDADDAAAEIAKLKALLAKQKESLDKATKEAGDAKKALRAKQSAEEIAAEEKKAAEERTAQEIDELRREVARTKAVKAVMSKLGTDEETSGKVAEYLYGAEDIDAALVEIQRAWAAKEKALKLEYGKVPPPGAGGANGEDAEELKALEMAKRMGQSRAANNKSVKDGLSGYMR